MEFIKLLETITKKVYHDIDLKTASYILLTITNILVTLSMFYINLSRDKRNKKSQINRENKLLKEKKDRIELNELTFLINELRKIREAYINTYHDTYDQPYYYFQKINIINRDVTLIITYIQSLAPSISFAELQNSCIINFSVLLEKFKKDEASIDDIKEHIDRSLNSTNDILGEIYMHTSLLRRNLNV